MSIVVTDGRGGAYASPATTTRLLYSVTDAEGSLLGWGIVDCDTVPGTERILDVSDGGTVAARWVCRA